MASREYTGMGGFVMSEKKKDENKKGIYEPAYTAFLPIGITFLTLGMTLDNMRAFLPVGIVFFIIGGITYGIPRQKTNDKFKQRENTDPNTTVDNDVPPQNEN